MTTPRTPLHCGTKDGVPHRWTKLNEKAKAEAEWLKSEMESDRVGLQHPDGRLMRFERINWADFRKHYRHPKQRPLKMRNTSSGEIFVLDLIPESSSEGA